MSDQNKKNPYPNITDDMDFSDLEALSKKYGIATDGQSSQTAPRPARTGIPARTPRIVYDVNDPASPVRIVYGNHDAPQGPEGRRVIYQEQEAESILEKRRRNAGIQKSQKGSQGFGSQPYVKHVASSAEAIKRDDEENFTRAYREAKTDKKTDSAADAPLTESKNRLVAKNPAHEKKNTREHRHYEKTAGEKFVLVLKSFIPWKGDPAKEVIRKIIMNVSAILVLVCFGYFINNYIQHHNELEKQESLKDDIAEIETSEDLEAQWAAMRAKYPDIDFPEGMNIKWAELYAKNTDLIGWLKIDNTNIDTPVMHTPSDKTNGSIQDFYLKRNFYKNYDKYGTPYLDKNNTGAKLDKNNTIYGHNMMDGLSFAQLEKYYTIEGFRQSPVIKFSTLYEDYYFKVYAAFITNGYSSGDNGYLFNYNMTHFPSKANFEKFIEAIDERKLYDTGVDITKEDTLITLSTCSYEIKQTDMGRLAVIGRLVREGESTYVDTSKATENTNIRYPQVWYNEHGMKNPYYDAYQWIPE